MDLGFRGAACSRNVEEDGVLDGADFVSCFQCRRFLPPAKESNDDFSFRR